MGVVRHAAPPKADQLPHPILSPALMGPSMVSGSSAPLPWSGLVLEKYVCNPGERPEGNALDRSVLVMVCSPTWRGEYKASNGVLKRETLGTLTILPKGFLPPMRSAQTADLSYCAFDEAFVKGVADELEGRLAPTHDKRGNLRDRAISEILNLLFAEIQSGGASGRLYVESLAQALTIRFLFLGERQPTRSSRTAMLPQHHLFRVQELIESRLEADVTLQELASEIGYSRSHFLRTFHATTGMTPHRYVLNRRIERARRLLGDAAMSIADVGYCCRFSSPGAPYARIPEGMWAHAGPVPTRAIWMRSSSNRWRPLVLQRVSR